MGSNDQQINQPELERSQQVLSISKDSFKIVGKIQ